MEKEKKITLEELEDVAGGDIEIIGTGSGGTVSFKETKCKMCGKTFLSSGSVYCPPCKYALEHGIST